MKNYLKTHFSIMIHFKDNFIDSVLKLQKKRAKTVRLFIIFLLLFPLFYTGCSKSIPADDNAGSGEVVSSWSDPVPITTSAGFNSYNISMGKDGTAIMVYSRVDDSKGIDRVFAKNYSPVSGWGEDIPIDKEGEGMDDSLSPHIAHDLSGSGDAFAVFRQWDGDNYRIYARRYKKDTGWSDNVTAIDNDVGVDSDTPQVAYDSSGNAMAVFTQDGKLYANKFDVSGSGWGTPEEISVTSQGVVNSPKICLLGEGQFMVLFYQYKIVTETMQLFAIRYKDNSWEEVPEQIDSDFHNFYEAVMRADGFGNLMVAFSEGAGNRLYVKRYYNGWKEAKEIGISSGKQVAIAYDIDHNASVLFVQDIEGVSHVYSSGYASSTDTWNEPVVIDGADTSNADNPGIIFDSFGRAVAIYSKMVNDAPHIFSARFDWSAGWQTPERIDGSNASKASVPEIVMDWEGNALVLYAVPDPGSGQIYAVRYTSGM